MDGYDDVPQQGLKMDCTLCHVINQKVDPKCPDCQGIGSYFREAQMMDRSSSSRKLFRKLGELSQMLESDEIYENPKRVQRLVFNILQDSQIYGFNLKTSLLELYRDLEV